MMRLRSISSKDQIAKQFMLSIFTFDMCTKVQWKIRGKEKRPQSSKAMFGHHINVIAVFVGMDGL